MAQQKENKFSLKKICLSFIINLAVIYGTIVIIAKMKNTHKSSSKETFAPFFYIILFLYLWFTEPNDFNLLKIVLLLFVVSYFLELFRKIILIIIKIHL